MKLANLHLKKWEILLVGFSLSLFFGAFFLYASDISIYKLVMGIEDTASEKVGSMAKIDGNTKRKAAQRASFEDISDGAIVYNQDTLVTDSSSEARVEFFDGSELSLEPNTMVRIVFSKEIGLGGVSRSAKIDVVAGRVTAKSTSNKLTLQSGGEKIVVKPGLSSAIKKREENSRRLATTTSPLNTPEPSPSVTPSPSPTPNPEFYVDMIAPRPKLRQSLPNHSKTFSYQMNFRFTVQPHYIKPRVVGYFIETIPTKKKIPLFKKDFEKSQAYGEYQFQVSLKRPGVYEWEVVPQDFISENKFVSRFLIKKYFKSIDVAPPQFLKPESLATRSPLEAKITWTPLNGVDTYEVSLLAEDKKSVLTKVQSNTHSATLSQTTDSLSLNYQVVGFHPSGFRPISKIISKTFEMIPPDPGFPRGGESVSRQRIIKDGNKIVFTWKKTPYSGGYEFQISEDEQFTSVVTSKRGSDNFFIWPKPPSGTFWWRVRSLNGSAYSAFSAAQSVTLSR